MFLRVCIHPVLTEGINLPFLLSCSHSLFINLCLHLHHKLLPRKCWTSELKIYYTLFFFFSPHCPLKSSQFWHFLSQSINIFRNATSTDSHSLIYRFRVGMFSITKLRWSGDVSIFLTYFSDFLSFLSLVIF